MTVALLHLVISFLFQKPLKGKKENLAQFLKLNNIGVLNFVMRK